MYAFVYYSLVLIFNQFVEVVGFVRWDKEVVVIIDFLDIVPQFILKVALVTLNFMLSEG